MNIFTNKQLYNGTLLERLPYNYSFVNERKDILFKIEDKKITIFNYLNFKLDSIILNEDNIDEFRQLYLHDIGHSIYYYDSNKLEKLENNDFGLSWNVETIVGEKLKYTYDDYIGELNAITISETLSSILFNWDAGCVFRNVFIASENIWLNDLHKNTILEKINLIDKLIDYWTPNKVHDIILKLSSYLIEKGYKC